MHPPHLLPSIRNACAQALHGHVPHLKTPSDCEAYIMSPDLGDRPGVIGALYLAQEGCSLFTHIGRIWRLIKRLCSR
jgi:hypothetical protein